MKYTQDEAIDFECAREAITDLIGIYTAQIYEEKEKTNPDVQHIENLLAERTRLAQEQIALHVTDFDKIAQIRRDYGAKIRAWRES